MNITDEQFVDPELLGALKQITITYCEKKLASLQKEFDEI